MEYTNKKNTNTFKIRKLKNTLKILITVLDRHQEVINNKNDDLFSDDSSLIFIVETHLTAFLEDDMEVANITDFVENYFNQA